MEIDVPQQCGKNFFKAEMRPSISIILIGVFLRPSSPGECMVELHVSFTKFCFLQWHQVGSGRYFQGDIMERKALFGRALIGKYFRSFKLHCLETNFFFFFKRMPPLTTNPYYLKDIHQGEACIRL